MLIFGFLSLFVALANSVQSTLIEPDKTIYVLTETLSAFLCLEALFFLIVIEVVSIAFYTKDSLLFAIINKVIRIVACLTLISVALSINTLQSSNDNPLGTTSIYTLKNIDEFFDKNTFVEAMLIDKEKADAPNTPPNSPQTK